MVHNGYKAGDALTATSAIPELPLEAVQLNAFTQCDIAEVFSRETLNIAPFTDETNHRHGIGCLRAQAYGTKRCDL